MAGITALVGKPSRSAARWKDRSPRDSTYGSPAPRDGNPALLQRDAGSMK